MRIIPKNTRVSQTIWKSFTLVDLAIAFTMFIFFTIIFMSNLNGKIYMLLFYCAMCVIMFFERDGIRAYMDLVQAIKFLASPKVFSEKNKRNNINALVPYTKFTENGVICYGDYYGRVISIGSIEFRLLNEWMQNMKISALGKILNCMSLYQSMQIVKIDRPVNFDSFSANLFEEVQSCENDLNKSRILKSRLGQIDAINNIDKQYRPFFYIVLYDDDIKSLDMITETTQSILTGAGILNRALSAKEVTLFLKYCYTRHFDERELDDILPENLIEYIMPKSIKFSTRGYEIDGLNAFNYAISDYPLEVGNAWGAALFDIDNTKVVLNIKPVEKSKAVRRVDRVVVELGSRENINKASQQITQSTHLETMAALLQSLQNENEALYDCTLTITGFNNEHEDFGRFKRRIWQSIATGGFRVNALRNMQLESFISSNISRRNSLPQFERGINTMSLASIFPFVFTSILEEGGVMLGCNDYPVILNPWKRGGKYINSNVMIIGAPGGGKSYFTKMLLTNLYSDNSSIFILDPENEYDVLCNNLGGTFIDVGNASCGRLNPFHIYQVLNSSDSEDDEVESPEVIYYAHLRFLEGFFQVTLPGITPDALELLNNLVIVCYEQRGIRPDTDCSELPPSAYPIFDDLLKVINNELLKETVSVTKANLQRLQNYLAKFATGGRNSNLWNGPATLTASENLTVFNFQSLLSGKNQVIANGQMLLVMKYLEQQVINIREHNKKYPNKIIHPVIALDEAYNFVAPKYLIALDFVYSWEKRIRKYWGMMIFITQNLKDLSGNAEVLHKTSAIINCSQYSFIFSLAPADIQELIKLYSNAGEINEVEQNQIASAEQGEVFLISSPTTRSCFRVVASEYVQELFTNIQ